MLNDKKLTLDKCGVIKVLMMLCVMFYHCICLWSDGGWFNEAPAEKSILLSVLCSYFNTFHIYVFTFISGYLFYYLKFESARYSDVKKDVSKRAKRLLLPYFVTAVFWCVPFYVVYFSESPSSIFCKFGLATSPNQLWFLFMLFWVFVFFYFISEFLDKHKPIIGLMITVVIYCISTVLAFKLPNVFQIFTAGKYIFFYYLGFLFRKYKENIFYRIPWIFYLITHITLFALYFFIIKNNDALVFKLFKIAIYPIINTIGVLNIIVGLSKFDYNYITQTRIFKLLNRHNFVMYLLHQQLIYLTISLFNSRVSTPLLVIINLAVSFSISLGMAIIISKIPVVKKAFGYI